MESNRSFKVALAKRPEKGKATVILVFREDDRSAVVSFLWDRCGDFWMLKPQIRDYKNELAMDTLQIIKKQPDTIIIMDVRSPIWGKTDKASWNNDPETRQATMEASNKRSKTCALKLAKTMNLNKALIVHLTKYPKIIPKYQEIVKKLISLLAQGTVNQWAQLS